MSRKNNPILSATKTLILIAFIAGSTIFSQPLTDEEKKILEMQDKRIPNYDISWVDVIENRNNIVNYTKNILALYNVNDSHLTKKIINEFNVSKNEDRRIQYLVVLSIIDSDLSRNFLLDLLRANEKYCEIILALLQNIGDEKCLEQVIQQKMTRGAERSEFFNLLYGFSTRRIGSLEAYEKANQLLDSTSYNSKTFIYSLNRNSIKPAIDLFTNLLVKEAASNDYATRMWSLSALGKQQDTSSIEFLLDALANENDWRVKVNIVNALGNYKIDMNSPLLEQTVNVLVDHAVKDPSVHVSIVSWQALGKIFGGADTRNPLVRKIQQEILFITTPGKAYDWQIKAEAIRTYAKIFKDEAKSDLFAMFNGTDNYDIKSAVVGAFGSFDDPLVYKELRENVSNDVMKYNELYPNKDGSMIGSNDLAKMYRAFVSALTELDDKMDKENRNIIRLILSEFASSKDAPLTDICLTNLQDSIYLEYRAETCQIMTFDWQSLALPKDKEVMLMYIEAWGNMKYEGAKEILTANLKSSDYDIAKASSDALKKITGEDKSDVITAPKYRTDFDWAFLEKLEQKKFATLITNQGNIIIELEESIAPFTVQNFVKLSEKGYYNNTIFHRIVPNFVIQGGDPTGTGYGGPGYSIRSEFSPLPFAEYTVGMASSGKDTEGSQFFITHSPQPHLDGRYTIFGRVIDGFDVVDKIQIGDAIETITFSASR